MEFLNNTRRIFGLLLVCLLFLLSCKKEEMYTAFYFDSNTTYFPDRSGFQPNQNLLEVFKFTDFPAPDSLIKLDAALNEILWLNAQKTNDFIPVNSSPGISDNNRTQMRTLYTNNALYLAAYCWDQHITHSDILPGNDLRNHSDVISFFIDPDNDGANIYCIQVTPNNRSIIYMYSTVASAPTIVSGNIYAKGRSNLGSGGNNRNDWYAEVIIPFSMIGVSPAAPGNTYKVNAVRQNYDTLGGACTFTGRYAWRTPNANENDSAPFYSLRFNSRILTSETFPVDLRGNILSAGPVNFQECGFTGDVTQYPYISTSVPLNQSLGSRVNPGSIETTYPANIGDKINYRAYVRDGYGYYHTSYTTQTITVR